MCGRSFIGAFLKGPKEVGRVGGVNSRSDKAEKASLGQCKGRLGNYGLGEGRRRRTEAYGKDGGSEDIGGFSVWPGGSFGGQRAGSLVIHLQETHQCRRSTVHGDCPGVPQEGQRRGSKGGATASATALLRPRPAFLTISELSVHHITLGGMQVEIAQLPNPLARPALW